MQIIDLVPEQDAPGEPGTDAYDRFVKAVWIYSPERCDFVRSVKRGRCLYGVCRPDTVEVQRSNAAPGSSRGFAAVGDDRWTFNERASNERERDKHSGSEKRSQNNFNDAGSREQLGRCGDEYRNGHKCTPK